MKAYLSRKDRARRLSNTIQYYITQLKDLRDVDLSFYRCNCLIQMINYSEYFALRNELNEVEKSLSRTNLIRTARGQAITHGCAVLTNMIPQQQLVYSIKELDEAIQRLEKFVGDLDSINFVDMYGKSVK
jgi:hypothetical protein